MSYKKYLEHRENIKVEVCLEKYRSHLSELVNKKIINEGCRSKELICKEKILDLVNETSYPKSEELRLVVLSDNSIKILKQLEALRNWNETKNEHACNELIHIINLYESGRYSDPSENDAHMCVESYTKYYKRKLQLLANKLENSIKTIKWKNYNLKLEAVPEKNDFSISKAIALVDDQPKLIFNLDSISSELINKNEIKEEYIELANNFNKINKHEISTFYVDGASFKKGILESMKKEMSLGIKHYLKEGTKLSKQPFDKNCWKVKIDENNVVRLDEEYLIDSTDVLIRFLERKA
jgi:hypothetical protein